MGAKRMTFNVNMSRAKSMSSESAQPEHGTCVLLGKVTERVSLACMVSYECMSGLEID